MRKDIRLWGLTPQGEILGPDFRRSMKRLYRADTPFDYPLVPYLLMVVCAAVDMAFFYALFSTLSYDSPVMLVMQISGLLLGFDVVPIYLGSAVKKLRQGMLRDKLWLYAALFICALAVALNVVLRLAVMDQLDPGQTSTAIQYAGETASGTETAEISSVAIAQTVLGICVPVLTSVSSFVVSYMTYDPLKLEKLRLEKEITIKQEELRRYRTILREYDEAGDHRAVMEAEDLARYQSVLKTQRALTVTYCRYVRQKLKEQLAQPAAYKRLSQDGYAALIQKLDRELSALEDGTWKPNRRIKDLSRPSLTSSSGEVVA